MSTNRIDARMAALKAAGQTAFIPFFTAGDPDAATTQRLLTECRQAGADIVELGFPFSDPVADGPTIQASYTRVLETGQTVADIFDTVRRARQDGADVPIVAMVSYSIVFRMGIEKFMDRAVAVGIDGATIPDLPTEELAGYMDAAAARDFRLICFVSPATSHERRALVTRHARGFIYYFAVCGITGERTELPDDLVENLADLRSVTDTPVAVGFGISTPEQAAAVAECADGVIVGSAIVSRMAAADASWGDAADAALKFTRMMSDACH
jgi:tryptophan synthase alpha chain